MTDHPRWLLLALAGTVIASKSVYVAQNCGLFLGGLALIFALVFLLRLPRRDIAWALIPAAALALLAIPPVGVSTWITSVVPVITAIAMIGAGAWLLLHARPTPRA